MSSVTDSHHTVLYLNLSYFCTICHATNFAQTLILYSCAKSCKKNDLNSVFMRNFVQRKMIYCEWMRNFMQNWFRTDTKMIQNFAQKSHFVKKRKTVAQLFLGNPIVLAILPPHRTTGPTVESFSGILIKLHTFDFTLRWGGSS